MTPTAEQIPAFYRHLVSDAEIESFVTKILTAALAAPASGASGQ